MLPRLKVSWIALSFHKDLRGSRYSTGYGMPWLNIGGFSKREMWAWTHTRLFKKNSSSTAPFKWPAYPICRILQRKLHFMHRLQQWLHRWHYVPKDDHSKRFALGSRKSGRVNKSHLFEHSRFARITRPYYCTLTKFSYDSRTFQYPYRAARSWPRGSVVSGRVWSACLLLCFCCCGYFP